MIFEPKCYVYDFPIFLTEPGWEKHWKRSNVEIRGVQKFEWAFQKSEGISEHYWKGWEFSQKLEGRNWYRVNFWICFDKGMVPQPSDGFGVKIQGKIYNDWAKDCKAKEWKYVSVVGPQTGNDNGRIILIFASVKEAIECRIYSL